MSGVIVNWNLMGFAKSYQTPRAIVFERGPAAKLRVSVVTCGLRREGPRKPLWRSRVLSGESIQAVHALKLAKSDSSKLDCVLKNRISRLIKSDALNVLAELQRQNEIQLAFKVFICLRDEAWYKPDLSLYCDMIQACGRNGLIEMADELFGNLRKEGLEPDARAFTELMGAYLRAGMIPEALETYDKMKEAGCVPGKLTFTILIRHLENAGEKDLAESFKRESLHYIDDRKFLKDVEQKYWRRVPDVV